MRLLLVKFSRSARSPFVSFVSVVDKSLTSVKRRLFQVSVPSLQSQSLKLASRLRYQCAKMATSRCGCFTVSRVIKPLIKYIYFL